MPNMFEWYKKYGVSLTEKEELEKLRILRKRVIDYCDWESPNTYSAMRSACLDSMTGDVPIPTLEEVNALKLEQFKYKVSKLQKTMEEKFQELVKLLETK